jgi:branched-chain amino acid transport system ATP-binding protein
VLENILIGLHRRGRQTPLAIIMGLPYVAREEEALRTEARRILEFVGLARREQELASALPYGEQRLVELAVALAAQPRMLLLDEPAAGMTGGEKELVSGLIRKIRNGGVTVFLVEHDMRMVMGISDTVIVLNHGRVIAEGDPAAIRAHPDVIRAYLGAGATRG